MFNIGPFEFLMLAIVGLVVLGPDKLPGLAKDAARLLRTLREIATGARSSLREELGPEFADLDLRNLNPRTAVQRALLGDDFDSGLGDLGKYNNPGSALQDFLLKADEDDNGEVVAFGGDGSARPEAAAAPVVPLDKPTRPPALVKPQSAPQMASQPAAQAAASPRPRPRPRPTPTPEPVPVSLPEPPPFDADAT